MTKSTKIVPFERIVLFMFSYKYKDGYINYNRDTNKVYFSHKSSDDIKNEFEVKYDDKVQVDVKDNDNLKYVQITFISTPFCNLSCKYCYEHTNKPFSELKTMSAEQHFEIYKSIQNYYPEAKIKICFFGGEPFLAKESIFSFIEMLKEHCEKNKLKVPTLSAITNGTLLLADTRKLIHDHFDQITFSLDGTKILNDSNRLYKDGRGSFDDIINNIQEFNKINSDKKVSTACELTLTDAYIENYHDSLMNEVWMLLKELKFSIAGFIAVMDDNSRYINKSENLDFISKDLVDLWFNDILNNTPTIKFTHMVNFLSMFLGGKTYENTICEAGHSYFAVDSNYDVLPCQVSAFQDNNVIGKIINSNLQFNENRQKKYISKKEHPLCKECECLKGCFGFCKVAMSNSHESIPNSCLFSKMLFKNFLIKIVEIIESDDKDKFAEGLKNYFKNGDAAYEGSN